MKGSHFMVPFFAALLMSLIFFAFASFSAFFVATTL
jgi:hypothetical protein